MNLAKTIRTALFSIISISVAAMSSGCDRLHEHLPECEHGLRLRFTYTWNMEFANAFPAQVDCLTLYIYDDNNRLVTTRTETTDVLADENYRMDIDLPDGDYTLVAYGGMACDNSSFHHIDTPTEGALLTSLETELNTGLLTRPVGTQLHNLFYGKKEVTVTSALNQYVDETIDMMRDTNNLRIMLQHVDGSPINDEDFNFYLSDNNTLMTWDNALLPSQEVTYYPWTRGTLRVGQSPYEELPDDVTMAYAEFSFCRLVTDNRPNLLITTADGSRNVVDLPLLNYLIASKSEQYKEMPAQEYLDRQHDWNMTFFLDSHLRWIYVEVKVLDWVVRINNIDLQ